MKKNSIPHKQSAGEPHFTNKIFTTIERFIGSQFFLYFSMVLFILQCSYMAVSTKFGLPPDETYHLDFIRLFSENNFSPFLSSQAGHLSLGEAVRTPFFLYHYLFSFPYFLIKNFGYGFIVLRFINILLSLGSIYITYKIALELKISSVARNLSIFMLTNTVMFVFLAASISYDNFFILLSLLTMLLTLKIYKKPTSTRILSLVATLLAGSLIKINFLPMIFVTVVLLAVIFRRSLRPIVDQLKLSFHQKRKLHGALCLLILLLGILCLHRYGLNLVKYRTYAPECNQVQSLEDCRKNGVFARDELVFGAKRLPTDKDALEFFYDWIPLIQNRTYGVFGHQRFDAITIIKVWSQLLVILGFVAVVRLWSKKDTLLSVALTFVVFYIFILLLENYKIYTGSGRFGFTVHGRYLFGVLPVLYLVTSHYILKLLSARTLRVLFLSLTILIFFLSSFPAYVIKTTPDWHTTIGSAVTARLKDLLL